MKLKNPFKLTVQDQIEKQIDDALFDLHQSRMQAEYFLNQITYLEKKLETLQGEKQFYESAYSESGIAARSSKSGDKRLHTLTQTELKPS